MALHATGESNDSIFEWIKKNGGWQITCIKFIEESGGVGLAAAKTVVDASPVWAEEMAATHRLRDDIERELLRRDGSGAS